MTVFVWTMAVLFALQVIGKLRWLQKGHLPPRTRAVETIDVVAYIGLLIWVAVLLGA